MKFIGAIGLAIAFASVFAVPLEPQKKPAGKPAADKYPSGCVSCHVKKGASDRRMTAELAKIKGHPNVAGMVKTVPTNCGMCHKTGPKPPKLMVAVHKIHGKALGLAAGAFGKKPAGACLNCHSANGKVKSGPKNW